MQKNDPELARLRAENERLRHEVARLIRGLTLVLIADDKAGADKAANRTLNGEDV